MISDETKQTAILALTDKRDALEARLDKYAAEYSTSRSAKHAHGIATATLARINTAIDEITAA